MCPCPPTRHPQGTACTFGSAIDLRCQCEGFAAGPGSLPQMVDKALMQAARSMHEFCEREGLTWCLTKSNYRYRDGTAVLNLIVRRRSNGRKVYDAPITSNARGLVRAREHLSRRRVQYS
jgi:hypothetical protein